MTDFHEHLCWQNQVERLLRHAAVNWADTSRRHLFLGNQVEGGAPFVVPAARANSHVWVMGGAGTGKSALVLAPLVAQLLANRVGSVVVFDPKPDKALFESCRLTASALGLRFRHVCITPGMSSYAFRPLLQSHLSNQTLTSRRDARSGPQPGLWHALRSRVLHRGGRGVRTDLPGSVPFCADAGGVGGTVRSPQPTPWNVGPKNMG